MSGLSSNVRGSRVRRLWKMYCRISLAEASLLVSGLSCSGSLRLWLTNQSPVVGTSESFWPLAGADTVAGIAPSSLSFFSPLWQPLISASANNKLQVCLNIAASFAQSLDGKLLD